MKASDINYNILKSLIPENDLSSFLAFESISILTVSGYDTCIIAPYRAPFSKKFKVSLDKYLLKEKELNRIKKLKNILNDEL